MDCRSGHTDPIGKRGPIVAPPHSELPGIRVRYANEPGLLRRFWWSGTQKRRLVVVSASALVSLAGTGLVVIGGGEASPTPTPAVAARLPVITTSKPVSSTDLANPVDPAVAVVTVRTVSAVDLFDGVDTTSGDPIRVRVADIRPASTCWQAESVDFARGALLGKEVRVVMSARGRASDGRLLASVWLSEGRDFALTALAAGAALAGAEVNSELLGAEAGARANQRGLWANGCSSSQAPTSSSTGEPTTTATTTAPRSEETTKQPTSVPVDPTTTTPPPDVQQGAQVGQPCAPEGAIGTDRNGRELTCRPTLIRGLRWAVR